VNVFGERQIVCECNAKHFENCDMNNIRHWCQWRLNLNFPPFINKKSQRILGRMFEIFGSWPFFGVFKLGLWTVGVGGRNNYRKVAVVAKTAADPGF